MISNCFIIYQALFFILQYEATANENEINTLVLRMPVEDKDLKNTPNWKSKFIITKGNENGNFRMETEPTSNAGLLYMAKVSDFQIEAPP